MFSNGIKLITGRNLYLNDFKLHHLYGLMQDALSYSNRLEYIYSYEYDRFHKHKGDFLSDCMILDGVNEKKLLLGTTSMFTNYAKFDEYINVFYYVEYMYSKVYELTKDTDSSAKPFEDILMYTTWADQPDGSSKNVQNKINWRLFREMSFQMKKFKYQYNLIIDSINMLLNNSADPSGWRKTYAEHELNMTKTEIDNKIVNGYMAGLELNHHKLPFFVDAQYSSR